MAKNKKNKPSVISADIAETKPEVKTAPAFEMGKKGDEFDLAYTKALREKTADTDKLLYDLSRESATDKFNFTDIIIPFVLIFFASLTFIAVARGDIEDMFTLSFNKDTLLDGSYTEMLDSVYTETLPFADNIKYAGSLFGFGYYEREPELSGEDDNTIPDTEIPVEPEVTEPIITTIEEVTTLPETVTTPETSETEYIPPETYVMYANATVNIRLDPSPNGAILGYFVINEQIDVIEIEQSGWARILYNDMQAYVYGEYLSSELTVTTAKTTNVTTTATETQEEEITSVPDDLDIDTESTDEEILQDE